MIGLKGKIPLGGQIMPVSRSGESLMWKNAQKNLKKSNTSLKINNIIPHFNPLFTSLLWDPWSVASRVISRHHRYIVSKIKVILKLNKTILFKCIILIRPVVSIKALKEPVRGQGLRSTIWK